MQHLSFTYNDAYKLPVWKRIWFLRKLKYNLEQEKQNISSQQSNKNLKNMFKKSF